MGYIGMDKLLRCKECGREFLFTEEEQAYYAKQGLSRAPTHCKDCRRARRSRRVYTGVCAACGKPARVPFAPQEGKLVYCGDCFAQMLAEKKGK